MSINIDKLVRKNIQQMKPYSSARHEFTGKASIFLDANENAFGSPLEENYNRYPDPLQIHLKQKIAEVKEVDSANIFLGNGSDEAVDLLIRIFCEPGKDNVIYCPPTYGMYSVCAEINDIEIRTAPLTADFQLNIYTIINSIDARSKLIFICSPNNPTGNSMNKNDVITLINTFPGLVIIDEAYIDYAKTGSFLTEITKHKNVVVLQTFSKAWGLASLRLGMAFADKIIIDYMNKVKYPYNINAVTQQLALKALDNMSIVKTSIEKLVEEKKNLIEELKNIQGVTSIFPSDANFILVKMDNAHSIYKFLTGRGIIVRDRSNVLLCEDCLRITIGTPAENNELLAALKSYQ